ncbi:MAG: nickel-type superoxide dismutase maturation protease [Dehalococcoidia bacterium]
MAFFALLGGAAGALAFTVRRRFLRYEVAGASMVPALDPGDYVIVDRTAYRRRLPRKGHVVLAHDPRDHAREIVKRVDRSDLHGDLWLTGDNAGESTASETFGAVHRGAIVGRVRWRYWPLRALFRVR